jgi:hypothetical protein
VDYGIFRVLEDAMCASDWCQELWMWMICTDILTNFLNHDPAMFRSFLLNRVRQPSVLGRLFAVVVHEQVRAPTYQYPFTLITCHWQLCRAMANLSNAYVCRGMYIK